MFWCKNILQNDHCIKPIYIHHHIQACIFFFLWGEILRSTLLATFQIHNIVLLIMVTMLYVTALWLIYFLNRCLCLSLSLTNTVVCGYGAWGSGSLLVTMRGDITGILRMGEQKVESIWVLQFSPVAQSCPTLCNPMNRSTPGLPVHHQLPELTQTHAHRVGDAIQPSHPLSSPSPPAPHPPQHQGLFQWVNSSHEVAKVLEFQLQHQSFQWTPRTDLL